jgi:hypothetical protein
VSPGDISTGTYLGLTPPLRDLEAISEKEYREMVIKAEEKLLNPKLRYRSYPYAETALPKGPDPVWQRETTSTRAPGTLLLNVAGQTSPYLPSDCNGTMGPNHYMQTINTTYAIYNRQGAIVAGPTNLNTLFSGVTGSNCNDGDPIVLYDEQADRWLVAAFSICGVNDYMLIAVSTTNDPTGTWHKYSFDVTDMPDYEKFGIWQDGYYMATNTTPGNDIYVFERSQMLVGGTAQMVAFDNPWRPTTIDGFVVVPPVDNDGDFAPAGSPGLFIAFNDDAIGGGSDQLWIYELDVNWGTPSLSTFNRVQQLGVAAFDSNFGNTWNNISQQGTSQKLDAIPMVIMNPPQYRNFGSYQTLVCCHTVDVNGSDRAGIRWYELRRTDGAWSVRQQGTYSPDSHSRWMGSIMLNGSNEIGLGYSISSSTLYPGIRYVGQSATAYAAASGLMDLDEGIIQNGANNQTSGNRWGDYSSMSIDPADDETFWFTTQYVQSGRATRIARFQIGDVPLNANFTASNTTPAPGSTVTLNDISSGTVTSRTWTITPNTFTFTGGTGNSSQNPQVIFNNTGYYTVTLLVSDGVTTDTETRTDYIHVFNSGMWTGTSSNSWNTAANWDGGILPGSTTPVTIPSNAPVWPVYTGNFEIGTQCASLTLDAGSQFTVNGNLSIGSGKTLAFNGTGILNISGNWANGGSFQPGQGTVNFTGPGTASITVSNSSNITSYSRTTFTKGMTPLSGATTGPTGDDGNSVVNIGFTFNYLGVNYTQARISTNGWIALNQTGGLGYDNNALFTSGEPNSTLAPWWDDLADDNSSFLYYKTEGSAPARVFTAEWNNIQAYYSGATARLSFQVKLFEGSNRIEFHYGAATTGTHNASEGASIGIEDATGGSGRYIEATTGSSTTAVTNLVSPAGFPSVNYRFEPPAMSEGFNHVTVNKPNGGVNFVVDANIAGSFTVSPTSTSTVSSGKQVNVNGN